MATSYGRDGPLSKPGGGEAFPTCPGGSKPPTPQPPVQYVAVLFPGSKSAGSWG